MKHEIDLTIKDSNNESICHYVARNLEHVIYIKNMFLFHAVRTLCYSSQLTAFS